MKKVAVEVLDREHGQKVIEAFKNLGIETGDYKGSCARDNGEPERFYGIGEEGFFTNRTESYSAEQGIKIITLEQLQNMGKSNQVVKNLKAVVTKEMTFSGEKRTLTVVTIVEDGVVKTGYAVCLPEDKFDEALAEKIATGRARKEKTNLTDGMVMGIGMDKKYIVYAIAENILNAIGKGRMVKGIRPQKKEEVKS